MPLKTGVTLMWGGKQPTTSSGKAAFVRNVGSFFTRTNEKGGEQRQTREGYNTILANKGRLQHKTMKRNWEGLVQRIYGNLIEGA